jgi:hypothetical protein
MLRTWIADVMGRLKQLGSHADGLEERIAGSSRNCRACLRPGATTTFTIRQWDPAGIVLVDTVASAQNLHVARAALREYAKQYPDRRMTLQIAAHVIRGCRLRGV